MYEMIRTWKTGDLEVAFFRERDKETVSMAVLPAGASEKIVPHREEIRDSVAAKAHCIASDFYFPTVCLESMIQLKFSGDASFPQHGDGVNMRNSATIERFRLVSQEEQGQSFRSVFESPDGMRVTHVLTNPAGTRYLECNVEFFNGSGVSRRVEMLESFSMGMISLLHRDDAPESLVLHRYTTAWSSEAKHLEQNFEDLNMELSWQAAGVRSQRFGQRSSMINKEYQPFAAVEDRKNGIVWAAAVDAVGPWQLVVSRFCDFVNISGGLPDREFAGWFRDVAPGETLTAPPALLTAVRGTCDDAARSLLPYQMTSAPEESLAPAFSDWCTSWGRPSEERLLKIAPIAADLGVKFFAVDAGWFKAHDGNWELDPVKFPRSFRAFSESLEKYGMKSGIWFEFETIIAGDPAETGKKDFMATLDGYPLKTGDRCFCDFRKPETVEHMNRVVADFLRDNKVGYLKVDYNAAIPFGTDGKSESKAENLQELLRAVKAFHEDLRRRVPGLKIEECSSGGHRMTPGWARFSDFISCSDAHEGVEIPLLAADALRVCCCDKALVWCVLRPWDDENRISYTMCAGAFGQITLSGDLERLSAEQLDSVKRYLDFCRGIGPDLRLNGKLRIFRTSTSRVYPKGKQCVFLETEKELLLVVHFFRTDEREAEFPLPEGEWNFADSVMPKKMLFDFLGNTVKIRNAAPFSAAAFRFVRA